MATGESFHPNYKVTSVQDIKERKGQNINKEVEKAIEIIEERLSCLAESHISIELPDFSCEAVQILEEVYRSHSWEVSTEWLDSDIAQTAHWDFHMSFEEEEDDS